MFGLIKQKGGLQMSSDTELAIKVDNVSKIFHIYERPIDRLKQSIFPRIRSLLRLPAASYCRNFTALESVNLNISRGQSVGILGKNGAGKSTLLQIICGTLDPTTGVSIVSG